MSERSSRPSSSHLEPPGKSAELEDSGAQDSVTSTSDEEYFSDASEGHQRSHTHPPSDRTSPVPRTRVEKVDGNPAHGDVPGTQAYEQRSQDAVPDEIEVVPEGSRSRSHSRVGLQDRPSTPGGSPIPQTLVEKVDPNSPSHGDIPGTSAYEQRKADAVPDFVMKMSDKGESGPPSPNPTPNQPNSADTPIPETRLSRVDSMPTEERTGPRAHSRSPSDALPDTTETISDSQDSPALKDSSTSRSHTRRRSTLKGSNVDDTHAGVNQEPVDDFDEFAEEQDMGEDDFGDFDDGFQEPEEIATEDINQASTPQPTTPPSI
ncbi:hypothetical protein PHISCL_07381, partial [Aspergillus sclerotialis]